ncbi:MAG: LuxR C-terminal-related transcriptional regulator [Myxococcota bacterium]
MSTSRGSPDLVSVVEAAYRVDAPNHAWLTGLVDAIRPALDDGLGMFAYLYDTLERPFRVHDLMHDTPVDATGVAMLTAEVNDEYVRKSWRAPSVAMASETEGFSEHPAVQGVFFPVGIHDVFAINARDDVGVGAWIGAPRRKLMVMNEDVRARWTRVAAHVRAALRLRMRLGKASDSDSDGAKAEAVLRPDGKIEHLEGDASSAKAALREAVLGMRRARGELRGDPDRALPSWRALVKARWSLIDDFETGGEHFIVARANSVSSSGLGLLSAREAQVVACLANGLSNKETAYELGISDSTVRVLVVRASQKLKVSGRDALIAAYRAESVKGG